MAISYDAGDLERMLRMDAVHGAKWAFALDKLKGLNHKIVVEHMYFHDFFCEDGTITIDNQAVNAHQAQEWMENGMRVWANQGSFNLNGNYFAQLARSFAADGPGAGNSAKSIGTTVDFALLFSSHLNKSGSSDMYDVRGAISLVCWVYADRWAAASIGEKTQAKVNIEGSPGGGPPGLHATFWDSTPGHSHDDQTHHFAGYFWFGADMGAGEMRLHTALSATGDWSIKEQKVTNQGDYNLGFMAARWGAAFDSSPGFVGGQIQQDLLNGTI